MTDLEIADNVIDALKRLATFNGIDIKTMQTTYPWSAELGLLTSQKIARVLKNMIDIGLVIKEVCVGKTVKYMLRETYNSLQLTSPKHKDFLTEEEENAIIDRLSSSEKKYKDMW